MKRLTQLTLLLSLLLISDLHAITGIVSVHLAPLFKEDNANSKVTQYIERGTKVTIHDQHVDSIYKPDTHYDFYKTLNRSGSIVYIKKNHVKLIYKDTRELVSNEKRLEKKVDETDYRIPEPIPEDYPIYDPNKYKSWFAIGTGPNRKISYPYNGTITGYKYQNRIVYNVGYIKKIVFDYTGRFYFGAMGRVARYRGSFEVTGKQLGDKIHTEESNTQVGLGPYLSYDGYLTDNKRFSVYGGLFFDYHRVSLEKQGITFAHAEARTFSAFTISPRIGSTFQYNIVANLDLMLGAELELNMPYSLNSNQQINSSDERYEEGWNSENDRIEVPADGQFTLFLGLQSRY